jgi:hypothetical protein
VLKYLNNSVTTYYNSNFDKTIQFFIKLFKSPQNPIYFLQMSRIKRWYLKTYIPKYDEKPGDQEVKTVSANRHLTLTPYTIFHAGD